MEEKEASVQLRRWEEITRPADSLEENVRRFFEILDTKEISSNDVEFSPTRLEVTIGSCRTLHCAKLERLLSAMKKQSGYERR